MPEDERFRLLWDIYHAACHMMRDGEDTPQRRQWLTDAMTSFEERFPEFAHGTYYQAPRP